MASADISRGVVAGQGIAFTKAVELFHTLRDTVLEVDLTVCRPDDLAELTAAVRAAQQSLELILVEIAIAAEAQAVRSGGRGAHGTLLGDGSRVRGRTARREADRGQLASEFDKVGRALRAGRIGAVQIDAIAGAAKGLDEADRPRLNTDAIVTAAASQPADVFTKTLRREVDRIRCDHGLADTKTRQARARWRHWFDERTGMGHVHGEFDPERYESITGAVEAELTRLANSGGVTKDDNLAAQAAYGLLSGAAGSLGPGRPHINVVVDWETFAHGPHRDTINETADGHRLAPVSTARLACDSVIQRIVIDQRAVPINVGRRHRTATDGQWQAVRAIYRACAWHGCDQPLARCQLHHIQEWENNGQTDLDNLVPLCCRHHHSVHEGGWSVRLNPPDRRLDIRSPDGRLQASTLPDRMASRPSPRPPPSEGGPGRPKRRRRQPATAAVP